MRRTRRYQSRESESGGNGSPSPPLDDEVEICPGLAEEESALGLLFSVAPQQRDCRWWNPHCPATPVRLREEEREVRSGPLQGCRHSERSCIEVDLGPPQREELPSTQAGRGRDGEWNIEPRSPRRAPWRPSPCPEREASDVRSWTV